MIDSINNIKDDFKQHNIKPTLDFENPNCKYTQSTRNKTTSAETNNNTYSNNPYHGQISSQNEMTYKINISNFGEMLPLELGQKFIIDLNKIDSSIPHDMYSHMINESKNGDKNKIYNDYKFQNVNFSRYEKFSQISLPDKFFEEYKNAECNSKIGMMHEIQIAYIIVDNKLILWNYKAPQSSFNQSSQFLVIDQLKCSILCVKLIKPKSGIFVEDVDFLLLLSTVNEIHIFIIKYNSETKKIELFDSDLTVLTQGLLVSEFFIDSDTNEIYFIGKKSGIEIWRLNYFNKSSFIKNKCEKVCLTKSGLSGVMQNKSVVFDLLSGVFKKNKSFESTITETIVQLEIDSERKIFYSLSNKSIIRIYTMDQKQTNLNEVNKLTPAYLLKCASNLYPELDTNKIFNNFKIINIYLISIKESSEVQLIVITNNGSRFFLKKTVSNSSLTTFLTGSFNSSFGFEYSLISIKFSPLIENQFTKNQIDPFIKNNSSLNQNVDSISQFGLNTDVIYSKIISPGIYLYVKKTENSDKLFIVTTNYGIFKKNNKIIEDIEFVDFGIKNDPNYTSIIDIVQLTPPMNATDVPTGYANVLSSQYLKEPLKFAVLTNFGISFFQYKTSDQILRSLDDVVVENFIEENGCEETCCALLYLACSYNNKNLSEIVKRRAQILFYTCGNSAKLINTSQLQSFDYNDKYSIHQNSLLNHETNNYFLSNAQIIFSDRFFGTCLLISRLFRNYWNKKVFQPLDFIKITQNGDVDTLNIKEEDLLIKDLNITKKQVEYFIGSITVLIDFFTENRNNVLDAAYSNLNSNITKYDNEISLRAETISFSAINKSLKLMREAFFFLMILKEEHELNHYDFGSIFNHLSIETQVDLLSLTFRHFLLPNENVILLIKDLLTSIINKNILHGRSIDFITSSLKTKCKYFCSTDDILIFKAFENLNNSKNINLNDIEIKKVFLKNAITFFEEAHKSLSVKIIQELTDSMLELGFYIETVEFLLDLAIKFSESSDENDQPFTSTHLDVSLIDNFDIDQSNEKEFKVYDLIFKILTDLESRSTKNNENDNDSSLVNLTDVKNKVFNLCLTSKSQKFHYNFYQRLVDNNRSERLLSIDSPFIFTFLEKKSKSSLLMSEILWLYYAQKEEYFSAANILYSLSVSNFDLTLNQRIKLLSRANGFCNCPCPSDLRQKMLFLSSRIHDLYEIGNIQLDILMAVKSDVRITKINQELVVSKLNNHIFPLNELFNSYSDPLGYYDLCLQIFKISDYKNIEDILKRWELFFEKMIHDLKCKNTSQDSFYVIFSSKFISLGLKLSSNIFLFSIDKLINLIYKFIYEAIQNKDLLQKPPNGFIVDLFIKSGVSFDRLYFLLRSLIENQSVETYYDLVDKLKSDEMIHLIKNWYSSDKKLKELISINKINGLKTYTIDSDPINKLLKENKVLI